jgi:DNA invertase Pin-like site-specific DNA recombinase
VTGEQEYKAILVFDISRWGRFQDVDEAAYYEFFCKKAGVPIHYCAEQFGNDDSLPSAIMKALKRVMASEFSRDLSQKSFDGAKAMILRGFSVGSHPGYALQRQLVSSSGESKGLLRDGERKSIKDDRIRLTPGPPEEIAWVHEIYRMFVDEEMSTVQIAESLEHSRSDKPRKALELPVSPKDIEPREVCGLLGMGPLDRKIADSLRAGSQKELDRCAKCNPSYHQPRKVRCGSTNLEQPDSSAIERTAADFSSFTAITERGSQLES